jgi:glutathione S-transferase
MRAWMLMRFAELPFTEIAIDVFGAGSREKVQQLGGESGLVPVLIADDLPIWDTLAIAEYLYERCPRIWPADPRLRARARSYAAEMHSGMSALRTAMPVNTRARDRVVQRSAAVTADIERVAQIWSRAGAGWLTGDFCAVDIMFAPVATRFRTYGVQLQGAAQDYCQRLLQHALTAEWCALGAAETAVIEKFEVQSKR